MIIIILNKADIRVILSH